MLDSPPSKLQHCSNGGIYNAVWTGHGLDEMQDRLKSWVEMHARWTEDYELGAQLIAFWGAHFAFTHLPNGDMLAIDTRNPDPRQQGVRYFSHEEDGPHGELMAVDFFTFISRWTALGCVGSEWWGWLPFMREVGEKHNEFDLNGKLAQAWRDWLHKDPDVIEPGAAPNPVPARAEVDLALILSAGKNRLDLVEQALFLGAQPDAVDVGLLPDSELHSGYDKDETPLTLAAQHNNIEMMEALLNAGASLAPHILLVQKLLLHTGYEDYSKASTVLWLIEHGARLDPWPTDRFNALHRLQDNIEISEEQYLTLLDAMIARGCDVNIPWDPESSEAKTTLLMRAKEKAQVRLLNAGADPSLRDLRGRTAMHFAESKGQIVLLQKHGLDINDLSTPEPGEVAEGAVANRPIQYALISAEQEAPTKTISAMLDQGADPALPDGLGRNAWWYCSHVECAKRLQLRLPFDPAMRDASGGTVLHRLVQYHQLVHGSSIPLLEWWVQRGLDINAQDANGKTALHWMATFHEGGYRDDSIRALLAQGARWDVTDAAGKTPRDLLRSQFRNKEW
ncbi:hypothetical protein G7048_23830 [Diaphorobacter sp. HDW4B]|uniref:ankyrin repeat domain-containing protein n=1 Tax=Diaphorobacter sp. HDW4B TaxID=2714925 RepID=UPI00140BC462|nr:ankyrin repeat domain-containing protein [Diaphorobacter sp. HDW4B]QIL73115.1 hypothetical protein G7048_23830 [Diaphorobacter sp. HDW4B]